MTVSKASPRRIRVSISVSVNSKQSCINETRPTVLLNFGSSQNISADREDEDELFDQHQKSERKQTRSCSPVKKYFRVENDLPDIVVSEPASVDNVKQEWEALAKEIEETTFKAKQREKKKKAKKAKVL